MARTVKPEAVAAKRKEILDATQRLVLTKGYEQMSIQDVLNEVGMSSGAFHHYFDSREALLAGLIEQIQQETEKPLLPIIHDLHLTAIEKLQGFFDTVDRLRVAHKSDIIKLMRVWYTDDNALVRQRVDEAILQQRAPLLTMIVHQGIREGSFTTAYPEQAGEILMTLFQGMGDVHANLFFSFERDRDEAHFIEHVVTTHAAYMDAIERVLGTSSRSFTRVNVEALQVWLAALRENDQP